MSRLARNAIPLAIVVVVAIAAYSFWPAHASLILLTGLAAAIPFVNAHDTPDVGWGVILRQTRVRMAYVIAMAALLCSLWAMTLGWLPPIVGILVAALALLSWSVFMITAIGPDGLRRLIEPRKPGQ